MMLRNDRYAPDKQNPRGRYIPTDELQAIVNMAITLGRPLLVKGPPGCGKTRLAYSVAEELGLELIPWYIQSTSRAKDGLYTVDMLRRLHDAQAQDPLAKEIGNYVELGPIGRAMAAQQECVILIDEIDKADIDFPNDLRRVLDEKRFDIPEQKREVVANADHPPIVIITSNDEKELSNAFLRRCLFHYIEFPDRQRLIQIVKVNLGQDRQLASLDEELIEVAARYLEQIRASPTDYRKRPETAEFLDWVRILHSWGIPKARLHEIQTLTELPHWELLFKYVEDLGAFRSAAG